MTEIPKPKETGSAGTQQTGPTGVVPIEQQSPLQGLPITEVVEGLAATRSRSMGGEVAANLIAGSFTQLSHNYQETRQELRNTRLELARVQDDLSDYKTKTAVLQERVNNEFRERHLKNVSITAGTVLVGIGIEFYRNNLEKASYVVAGLGLLLIFLGWFSRDGGTKK